MPVVNVQTGKMINVKKNSLTYWHEKGHIKFANTYAGMLFNYCADAYLKTAVCLLVINSFFNWFFLKVLNLALVLSIAYFYIYEELWCWQYAYKNGNKKQI